MKLNKGFACIKVSTKNLGDHIQILACQKILEEFDIKTTIYIDRDTELGSFGLRPSIEHSLPIIINGWFKKKEDEWPPSEKLIPLLIGFHIRLHKCKKLISKEAISFYKRMGEIGCRDPYTASLLRQHGVNSYVSNCLTLCFDKRKQIAGDKIIISSRDKDLWDIMPEWVKEKAMYINHYSREGDFTSNMAKANELIDEYRYKASLVVTSFLHCALPCIAMGIPTIVFYPRPANEQQSISDTERFSGLASIIRIYSFAEIDLVDWNPKVPDVDNIKELIRTKVLVFLTKIS